MIWKLLSSQHFTSSCIVVHCKLLKLPHESIVAWGNELISIEPLNFNQKNIFHSMLKLKWFFLHSLYTMESPVLSKHNSRRENCFRSWQIVNSSRNGRIYTSKIEQNAMTYSEKTFTWIKVKTLSQKSKCFRKSKLKNALNIRWIFQFENRYDYVNAAADYASTRNISKGTVKRSM